MPVDSAPTAPPWGYKQVVPLQKSHRVRLTEPGMAPAFSLDLHAVPLGASEFSLALRDYPISFLKRGGKLEVVAVLGIEEGQNLFVMPDGRWDRRTYMPAYVRRYPFCMTHPAGEAGRTDHAICVDPAALGASGDPLFDNEGNALPHWVMFERLLKDYEEELARAHRLAETLQRLDVLSPFSLRADLASGFSLSLNDMYRVDRAKLGALAQPALTELITGSEMDSIYAHLLSQDNFLRLMSRRGLFAPRAVA
jgi:hypothetical protein